MAGDIGGGGENAGTLGGGGGGAGGPDGNPGGGGGICIEGCCRLPREDLR